MENVIAKRCVIFNDIFLIYLNLIRSFCWYVTASQTEHLFLGLLYRPPPHYAPKERVNKISVSYKNFKTTIWGSGRDVVQEKTMAEERGIQLIWCLHYLHIPTIKPIKEWVRIKKVNLAMD